MPGDSQPRERIEAVRDFYNNMAENWDQRFSGTRASEYFLHSRLQKIRACLGNDFHTLLEVGCGTGFHLLNLLKKGQRGLGVDFSENMLAAARNHLAQHTASACFLPGDAEHLPLRGNAFDRVLLVGLLEHVPHPEAVLEEIHRTLARNGRVVGMTSNRWSPWCFLKLRKVFAKDYGVLKKDREFSPPEMKALLRQAGFRNIRIHLFNSLPGKLPDWLYYPSRTANLIFSVWPVSQMGWHLLFTGTKA